MAVHRVSAGAPARAGRAAVFATASVCLALAAHSAGGGGHPPLVVVLAAVGLAARVSYGLAGRERGIAELTVGLGAGQFALHLAFTLATLDPAAHAGADPGGHSHLTAMPHTAPMMLLAHALAAGVTVVALRQAERTLWAATALRSWLAGAGATALARFVRLLAALRALAPARRLFPPRPVVPACPSAASRADAMIGRTSRRRGPPGRVETSSAVPDVALRVALSHG